MAEDHKKPNPSNKLPQLLASQSAALGAFSAGVGLGWPSPALPYLSDCADQCDLGRDLGPEVASWIGGIYMLGGLVSCLIAGRLIVSQGARRTMLIMSIPCFVGWALLVMVKPLSLQSEWWFFGGRFLLGIGGGAYPLAVPLYVSETAETSLRGALGTLVHFNICLGILFVNGAGALLNWATLTTICLAFPALVVAFTLFIPESPYYLISEGKEKQARTSLQWLRGKSFNIESEIQELRDRHKRQASLKTITLKVMFTKTVYVKPMLIMVAMMVLQQYSGALAMLIHRTEIFNEADTGLDSGWQATLVSLVPIFVMLLPIFVVDKVGRRPLLVLSCLVTGLSLVSLGIYFRLKEDGAAREDDDSLLESLGWLPLASMIANVIGFNVALGPLPWMMCGEMFTQEAKPLSASVANVTNWLLAFVVTKTEVNVQAAVGASGSYFLYAFVCAVGAVFVAFVVPETRGSTPEQMKVRFQEGGSGKETTRF